MDYLSALSGYIRKHDSLLAAASPSSRLVLSVDPHHLYYLLLKFEEASIPNLGLLDAVQPSPPARPMAYPFASSNANGSRRDSDSTSVRSSAWSVMSSSLSLGSGSGWWGLSGGGPAPVTAKSETELVHHIYSSITKLPALTMTPFYPPSAGEKEPNVLLRPVKEFEDLPPPRNLVPLNCFKNVQALTFKDLDPRFFSGWDVLSTQLRSLDLRQSGIEDVGDLVCTVVVRDHKARQKAAGLVLEEDEDDGQATPKLDGSTEEQETHYPIPPRASWARLVHLSVAQNSLTFLPSEPLTHLSALTSLDLSSNLLNAVPPALSHLYSLRSLNLSDNMIDSVVGIWRCLGNVAVINLSKNRIESLSGLERVFSLERIDLRENALVDALEVSRLAPLPLLKEVWVASNPFSQDTASGGESFWGGKPANPWRLRVLEYFAKEGNVEASVDGHRATQKELKAFRLPQRGRGSSTVMRRSSEGQLPAPSSALSSVHVGLNHLSSDAEGGDTATTRVVAKRRKRVVTAPAGARPTSVAFSDNEPGSPSTSSEAHASPGGAGSKVVKKKPSRYAPGKRFVHLDGPMPGEAPTSSGGSGSATEAAGGPFISLAAGAEALNLNGAAGGMDDQTGNGAVEDEEQSSGGVSSSGGGAAAAVSKAGRYATLGAGRAELSRISEGTAFTGSLNSPKKGTTRRSLNDVFAGSSGGDAPSSPEGLATRSQVVEGGEAFRARMEKLRNEVGETYLAVLEERERVEEVRKKEAAAAAGPTGAGLGPPATLLEKGKGAAEEEDEPEAVKVVGAKKKKPKKKKKKPAATATSQGDVAAT